MNRLEEVRLKLLALGEGIIDPELFDAVGAAWSSTEHPPLLRYLADRGVLSKEQVRLLEEANAVTRTRAVESHLLTVSYKVNPMHQVVGPTDSTASAATPDPAASTASDFAPHSAAELGNPSASNGSTLPPVPGGRYRIRRLHQTGGLGQVWVAEDTAIGRVVAVKTIRPERAGDVSARDRFVREARVTGRLEHPCIVPLYDLMSVEQGDLGPCYAMRFLAGRTLAQATAAYHTDRGAGRADPLAFTTLLDALISICRAVAFAHDRSVLHRDLKGQNVVLGDFGEVFLIDWGLAQAIGVAAEPPGTVVGTPGFIAPEVAAGGQSTIASDVYGLGAMLYTILTGRAPYHTGSPAERIRQAAEADPPPVLSANPATPAALAAVCGKAMARNPDDRYPSANALAVELRRFLADEPLAAYRESLSVRVGRWVRRHRTGATVAAGILITAFVALAVSTTVVWRERERTAEQKRFAEAQWARAESEQSRAEQNFATARALALDMGDQISQIETGQSNPKLADQARKKALDKAREQFDEFRSARPDDVNIQMQSAALHRFAANISRLLSDYPAAVSAYAAAVEIWEVLTARFPDEPVYRDNLAETLRDRSMLEKRMGKLTTAAATLDRSLQLAEEPQGTLPDSACWRTVGTIELERAEIAYARGKFDSSAEFAGRAVELLDRLKDAPSAEQKSYDRLLTAMAVNALALARRGLGKIPEALAAHEDAVARMKDLAGPKANRDERFWNCEVRRERARTSAAVPEQWAAAANDLEDVILIADKLVEEYPHVAFYREGLTAAYLRRGELLTLLGKVEPAITVLDKSLIKSRELITRHGNLSATLLVRGEAFLAKGKALAAAGKAAEALIQWNNAAIVFNTAIKDDPENYHHCLGAAEVERALKTNVKR